MVLAGLRGEQLADAKAAAGAGLQAGSFLSTNDALVCLVANAVRCKQFGVVVDLRERTGSMIPFGCLANAILVIYGHPQGGPGGTMASDVRGCVQDVGAG